MAVSVLCQPLSIASKTLRQALLSWPITQGNVARFMSSQRASLIGSYEKHGGARTNQQLAFFQGLAPSDASRESKYTALRKGRRLSLQTPSDMQLALELRLTRLTLTPLESRLSLDLMLPAPAVQPTFIKDPSHYTSLRLGCPTAAHLVPLTDPMPEQETHLPSQERIIRKQASNILHKRRRKMNRHQYLKWKKRNKFKLRIQKQRSRKKKRLQWEQHLDKFRFTGLRPGEGEAYLAKQREKRAIYLHYLGIQTDEEEADEKVKTGKAAVVGRVIPERPLPQGAKI